MPVKLLVKRQSDIRLKLSQMGIPPVYHMLFATAVTGGGWEIDFSLAIDAVDAIKTPMGPAKMLHPTAHNSIFRSYAMSGGSFDDAWQHACKIFTMDIGDYVRARKVYDDKKRYK